MPARYAFAVTVRLEPPASDVSLDPSTFETTCWIQASEPGTADWMLFRDLLWRGEISDQDYARRFFTETVGVPVESVDFRGFHTDETSFEALKAEIATTLDTFNAENVTEVISKYFGSSLVVESPDEP